MDSLLAAIIIGVAIAITLELVQLLQEMSGFRMSAPEQVREEIE